MQLPKNIAQDVHKEIFSQRISYYLEKEYFPAHVLPRDACFVIRHAELDKLINIMTKNRMNPFIFNTNINTTISVFLACL